MLAVVEVVSPSTRRIDRLVKPGVYAEAGIPTFWRLELDPTAMLTVFSLEAGTYVEATTVHAGERTQVFRPYLVTVDI